MNYFKYTLISIILASATLFSCGDDKTEGGIQHRESTIESTFGYIGSSSGVKELHPDSIKKILDRVFPATLFEEYADTYFIFLDEMTVAIDQGDSRPEINKYIFENGSLYLINNDTPVYYGEGDTNELKIRQHYVAYKRDGEKSFTTKQITPRKEVSEEDAATETPFLSIENIKSSKDTLIWCTRSSIFK
ncbi:hypothetical protein [Dysgonomonas sp. Marseille-P4361]|uniref:hypothetical protein n=1 Tax=Dysgonomonas sp. Marseille-P4361 TaxID=2161820 RepID=UPI000D5579D9|nr:hypothetical protein [Dysgonomonas sp. Marseille-P4361]